MYVAPTQDHLELTGMVGELLATRCSPETVRQAWQEGPPMDLWRQLAEVGVLSALIPEEQGGMGLDESFLYLLAQELGYAGVPLPVVEAMCLGPVIATLEYPRWARVAEGKDLATWGDRQLVAWGAEAAIVILCDGKNLQLATGQPERLRTVDRGRPAARFKEDGDSLEVAAADCERLVARATLASSGLLVGLSRRMLDLAVSYTKEREQFGQPIGAFQAVKHHLADAAIAIEFADPMGLAAGWQLAKNEISSLEVARQLAAAKLLATRAATTVARRSLQVHGAMGYTTEYDLHLYAKRVWALVPEQGSPAEHRRTLSASLGLD